MHKFHRVSAYVIGSYVAVHLFNHLLALNGVDAHIQFMQSFRHLYRKPVIEVLLLASVAFQAGSGLYLIKNRWGRRQGFFERIQALSGAYLAFFLLVHVGAVLVGRNMLDLDTNFYYAAAGMHVPPFQYFFVPYYFLAVVAILSHIACALHWLTRITLTVVSRNYIGYAVIAVGIVTASLIVAAFAGAFYPIAIPQAYRATYL